MQFQVAFCHLQPRVLTDTAPFPWSSSPIPFHPQSYTTHLKWLWCLPAWSWGTRQEKGEWGLQGSPLFHFMMGRAQNHRPRWDPERYLTSTTTQVIPDSPQLCIRWSPSLGPCSEYLSSPRPPFDFGTVPIITKFCLRMNPRRVVCYLQPLDLFSGVTQRHLLSLLHHNLQVHIDSQSGFWHCPCI